MFKKLFTVTALIALTLSACSAGTPTEPPAATEVPATTAPSATLEASATVEPLTTEPATLTPDATASPATAATQSTVSATATVGTPRPTNPPDCTNSASFVSDVTVPDNTNIAGGTAFTKTWRISNNGTCVWGPDYTLVHYSDETLGAPLSVPLGITQPGETLDVSVNLTAPNTTGTHRGNFVIENPAGLIMKIGDDSRLWVIINVTVTAAATSTASLSTQAASATPASAGSAGTPAAGSNASSTTGTCDFTTDRAKLTEVINAVNAYRAQRGLPAYTVNAQLAQAAQRHANDIACNKLYVHTGSDGSTAQSRVRDTGYSAASVSENVNGNNPPFDGQAVVNWWINDKTDPRHSQNLVSTSFTQIGVGYSFYDDYGFYALVFARP